jgi:drug/metabolite transporter (DMT)-like permease
VRRRRILLADRHPAVHVLMCEREPGRRPDTALIRRDPLSRHVTGWPARLLLLGAIWGTSFLLIKIGVRAFTPVQVAFGRMLFGVLALVPVVLAQRTRLPRDARTWAHLGVAALLLNSAPFTLFALGEEHVSSVLAGIWNGATPLFVLIVVLATLPEERPTRDRIAGLALGFAGVLVVFGAWRGLGQGELVGNAACLGATLLYGFGFPYARRYLALGGLTIAALAFGQLAIGTVQVAVVLPFAGGIPGTFPAGPLGAIVALGAIGTGAAYLLNYSIIRDAGATNASTVGYLVPVFATVAGVALLGEPLSWNEPAGGLLVLLGVAASQGRLTLGRMRPSGARA